MHLSRWQTLGPTLLLAAVSWAVALVDVARDYWFGAADLRPFAFWCLLAAAFAHPAMRSLQRRTARARNLVLVSVASLAGLAFGVAWTYLVALILGGWIGAFGFPVLLCWIVGSVVGFLGSAVAIRPRVWLGAAASAVALPIAAAGILAWLSQAPPDAIVYFKPGTTHEQVTHVWNEVVATPTARGTTHLEGVQSMAAAGDATREGIRLSFRPGTSEERKTEILSRTDPVPYVDEIVDTPRATREDVQKALREFHEMEQSQ
jgi:hypothetical protein